jgi:hypothetical protein
VRQTVSKMNPRLCGQQLFACIAIQDKSMRKAEERCLKFWEMENWGGGGDAILWVYYVKLIRNFYSQTSMGAN